MSEQIEYVIGIEVCNGFANIGYYDEAKEQAVVIDTSFGYGKPSFPTIIHYLENSDEWIFGEFALNNDIYEDTVVFIDILNLLENKHGYLDLDAKIVTVPEVLSKFFKELLSCFHNVNPNGKISKIKLYYENRVDYNIDHQNIVMQAFELINVDKNNVDFITLPQLIINKASYINVNEQVSYFWIDPQFCYFANILKTDEFSFKNTIETNTIINSNWFEEKFYQLLLRVYLNKTDSKEELASDNIKWKIKALTYNYKDLLINKYQNKQDVKIYYNFVYPAFEGIVNFNDISDIINEYMEIVTKLFLNATSKMFICVNSLESDLVKKIFNNKIEFTQLNVIKELITFKKDKQNIKIIDKDTWDIDIGVFVIKNENKVFVPIINKGNLKNKIPISKSFYYKNTHQLNIDLYCSIDKDNKKLVGTIFIPPISELIKITKIIISISHISDENICVNIEDCGFGEIFQSSGFHGEYIFEIQ